MHSGLVLLAYLTLQRTIELVIARRNTAALLANGAYEVGAGHYPAIVALHASWLATLWIFGWNHDLIAAPVAAFALLQAGRWWVLQTLGKRWTTRSFVTECRSSRCVASFKACRTWLDYIAERPSNQAFFNNVDRLRDISDQSKRASYRGCITSMFGPESPSTGK